ncbi:MAG: hypothetical protein HY610_03850 [Elusimicrobia bacterium]|nr:hypothetical protein [Elusimicrobiota bacterium]
MKIFLRKAIRWKESKSVRKILQIVAALFISFTLVVPILTPPARAETLWSVAPARNLGGLDSFGLSLTLRFGGSDNSRLDKQSNEKDSQAKPNKGEDGSWELMTMLSVAVGLTIWHQYNLSGAASRVAPLGWILVGDTLSSGVAASLGSLLNEKSALTPLQSGLAGAAAGMTMYFGKFFIANDSLGTFPWGGKLIHSFGTSVSSNLVMGKTPFKGFETAFGPLLFIVDDIPNPRFRVAIMPITLLIQGVAVILGNELDFERTLTYGVVTFRTDLGKFYNGMTLPNTIFLNRSLTKKDLYSGEPNDVMVHENMHIFQYHEIGIPIASWDAFMHQDGVPEWIETKEFWSLFFYGGFLALTPLLPELEPRVWDNYRGKENDSKPHNFLHNSFAFGTGVALINLGIGILTLSMPIGFLLVGFGFIASWIWGADLTTVILGRSLVWLSGGGEMDPSRAERLKRLFHVQGFGAVEFAKLGLFDSARTDGSTVWLSPLLALRLRNKTLDRIYVHVIERFYWPMIVEHETLRKNLSSLFKEPKFQWFVKTCGLDTVMVYLEKVATRLHLIQLNPTLTRDSSRARDRLYRRLQFLDSTELGGTEGLISEKVEERLEKSLRRTTLQQEREKTLLLTAAIYELKGSRETLGKNIRSFSQKYAQGNVNFVPVHNNLTGTLFKPEIRWVEEDQKRFKTFLGLGNLFGWGKKSKMELTPARAHWMNEVFNWGRAVVRWKRDWRDRTEQSPTFPIEQIWQGRENEVGVFDFASGSAKRKEWVWTALRLRLMKEEWKSKIVILQDNGDVHREESLRTNLGETAYQRLCDLKAERVQVPSGMIRTGWVYERLVSLNVMSKGEKFYLVTSDLGRWVLDLLYESFVTLFHLNSARDARQAVGLDVIHQDLQSERLLDEHA